MQTLSLVFRALLIVAPAALAALSGPSVKPAWSEPGREVILASLAHAEEPANDTTRDAYLLWTAVGGFAGIGPAVEVRGEGTLRLWSSTAGLRPHEASGWEQQIELTPAERHELFTLLSKVNFSALPHRSGVWRECYPYLYYEPCRGCSPITLDYGGAEELQPEMNAVYAWFDEKLGARRRLEGPSNYCVF